MIGGFIWLDALDDAAQPIGTMPDLRGLTYDEANTRIAQRAQHSRDVRPARDAEPEHGLASERRGLHPVRQQRHAQDGALGYGYASSADLSWRCNVEYRGYVRDVDINRR